MLGPITQSGIRRLLQERCRKGVGIVSISHGHVLQAPVAVQQFRMQAGRLPSNCIVGVPIKATLSASIVMDCDMNISGLAVQAFAFRARFGFSVSRKLSSAFSSIPSAMTTRRVR